MPPEDMGTSPLGLSVYPKAHVLNRFVAKLIDAIIALAAASLIPNVGMLAGLAYILIADGFAGGQSIGKRLIGLQTVVLQTREASGFKESIVRNLPFALAYLVVPLPFYVGWLLAGAVVTFEALLVIGNEQGLRLGDEVARTQVLDAGLLEAVD